MSGYIPANAMDVEEVDDADEQKKLTEKAEQELNDALEIEADAAD